jgi:HD-GYP domain-containing protein (c-di-GMP phosphodiesterase class II)
MKTHTMVGFNICRPLQLSTPVLMIIRSHHEKLDGSGYPDKLKGDELPLPVRIAGVAIAFDAMKSKRPWREALTAEATLGELNKVAGRQFDAHVVQTLKELVDHPSYARIYPDEQKRFREAA